MEKELESMIETKRRELNWVPDKLGRFYPPRLQEHMDVALSSYRADIQWEYDVLVSLRSVSLPVAMQHKSGLYYTGTGKWSETPVFGYYDLDIALRQWLKVIKAS